MALTLARMFYASAANNAWSNHRLLTACLRLSQDEFVAQRTSFFPSIKATLNHVLTVDWYYVDAIERALRGEPVNSASGAFFEPEEPFEVCADLARAQRAVDRRLLAAASRLETVDPELGVPIARAKGVDVEPLARMLAHLFQHQIHHRGQAHAMLAGTSVAPPQLDEFFCANEAHLRAAELAELGLDEAGIWG